MLDLQQLREHDKRINCLILNMRINCLILRSPQTWRERETLYRVRVDSDVRDLIGSGWVRCCIKRYYRQNTSTTLQPGFRRCDPTWSTTHVWIHMSNNIKGRFQVEPSINLTTGLKKFLRIFSAFLVLRPYNHQLSRPPHSTWYTTKDHQKSAWGFYQRHGGTHVDMGW